LIQKILDYLNKKAKAHETPRYPRAGHYLAVNQWHDSTDVKTNGLIQDAARRGDGDGAVDFGGSPRQQAGLGECLDSNFKCNTPKQQSCAAQVIWCPEHPW